jgi:hypothetical protein
MHEDLDAPGMAVPHYGRWQAQKPTLPYRIWPQRLFLLLTLWFLFGLVAGWQLHVWLGQPVRETPARGETFRHQGALPERTVL